MNTSPPNPHSKMERGNTRNTPSHVGKGSGVRSIFGQNIDPIRLARAKELRRDMTEAEKVLWQALRTNQFRGLHFRRQQIIDGFIADFYCHAGGLVVEVDGASHQGRVEYDAERDVALAASGLRVLRFTNEEVLQDVDAVLERIAIGLITSPSHPGKGLGVRSPGVRS